MTLKTSNNTFSTFSTQAFVPLPTGSKSAYNIKEPTFLGFYNDSQQTFTDNLLAQKNRFNPFTAGSNNYLDQLKSSAKQTSIIPKSKSQYNYTAQIQLDDAQNLSADNAQNYQPRDNNVPYQSNSDNLQKLVSDKQNLSDEAAGASATDVQNNNNNINNNDKTSTSGFAESYSDKLDNNENGNNTTDVNQNGSHNLSTGNNQQSNTNTASRSHNPNPAVQTISTENNSKNSNNNSNNNPSKPSNMMSGPNITDQNSNIAPKAILSQTQVQNTATGSASMSNPFPGLSFTRLNMNNPGNHNGLNQADTPASGKSTAEGNLNLTNSTEFSSQTVKGLMAVLRSGGGALTMKLEPEALGQLRIQMSMNGGNVSVQFHADSPEARMLLQQSLDTLKSALEQNGLKLEQVTIQPLSKVTDSGTVTAEQLANRVKTSQGGNDNANEHNAAGQQSRGHTDQQGKGSEQHFYNSQEPLNPNQKSNWQQQLDDLFGTNQYYPNSS